MNMDRGLSSARRQGRFARARTFAALVMLGAIATATHAANDCAVTLRNGEVLRGELRAVGANLMLTLGAQNRQLDFANVKEIRRIEPDPLDLQQAVGDLGPKRSPEWGLKAEYFMTTDCTREPRVRVEPAISIAWTPGTLPEGMNREHLSVRWTGQLVAPVSETYTFSFWDGNKDPRPKLWIGEKPVLDGTNAEGPIALVAGQKVSLRLEAFIPRESAGALLCWESPGQSKQVVPAECLLLPTDYTPAKQASDLLADAGRGLRAEYAADPEFKNILLSRLERQVSGNPVRHKVRDSFSARWTGRIRIEAGDKYPVKLLAHSAKTQVLLDGKPVVEAAVVPPKQDVWRDLAATATGIPVWGDPRLGRWDSRGWMYDIDSTNLACPSDMPVAALLWPPRGFTATAGSVPTPLEAVAGVGQGQIKLVEFLQNGKVLGKSEHPPYRTALPTPDVGAFELGLRVTSGTGATNTTSLGNYSVRTPASGLEWPWWEMAVGSEKQRMAIQKADGAWRISGVGSDWAGKRDEGMLLGQEGMDGELTLRIKSVGSGVEGANKGHGESVGLQCRESSSDTPRSLTLLVGDDGKGVVVTQVRSSEEAQTEAVPLAVPCWLRIQTSNWSPDGGPGRACIYSSTDRKVWRLHGTLEGTRPCSQWQMGLVLGSFPHGPRVSAVVEKMEFHSMRPMPRGVQLTDGSVVAGTVTKDDGVAMDIAQHGRTVHVPANTVSKVFLVPLTLTEVERDTNEPGVFVGNMDFVEGSVSRADKGAVNVNSIALGLLRFTANQVRAVVHRGITRNDQAMEVHTRDGSRWRTTEVTVHDGKLLVKHPLGPVELPLQDLVELRNSPNPGEKAE